MRHVIRAGIAAAVLLAACSAAQQPASPAAAAAERIVPGSQADLVANVGNRVLFDFDRADLKPEAKATLDRQAAWLKKWARNNVLIAGNCDERGTTEYNIVMGQRRADAAGDYLISSGVEPARIRTISYGKERPVALGSTELDWAQNRNATTTVE
ncbi:peptidoglycan-associated lipoprotein Pal [Limobrevibacterium gyesilva]|uniref:Peptidoglycan-associated lipoprotein n=1 Tax=Limobrevibacterium gyesilva TaxID=2991712 RepID=A0AA42CIS1_9PROT|nr:peptidoglycan-associated lipoprotein Pal [Limobrevibacterium gyesilva]MCW3476180.1 peptidoglycan-associated lipoprotein Pal [Limobrevibacterium gyesilva]